MEFQVTKGRMGSIDTVFDDVAEKPLDCDFLLPEYMPEMTAILKCRAIPRVQSHQISGDRVMADGVVCVQLLYLDEGRRCVHSYECSQPFTAAFTVKDIKSGDGVQLSAKTNYVNCRATAPRRVEVRGAISICLTVTAERRTEVVTAAEGQGLCTQNGDAVCTVPSCRAEKTISLSEVLELGATSVSAVLRCEANVMVGDVRLMPSKAVVKGEVLLETVCVADAESGAVVRHHHRLPFSQIVDGDGLGEDCLCDATAAVTHCDVRLMQDPAGETRLLSVAVKLTLGLQCYRTEKCHVLTDAYHVKYPLKTETCHITARRLAFVRTDVLPLTAVVALPDSGIAELLDVWCEPMGVTCTGAGENTLLSGQLLVCMLTRDNEGTVAYYERPTEFTLTAPDTCETVRAAVVITETSCTQSGDQIELRAQAAAHRIGWCEVSCTTLTALAAEEDAPYTDDGLLSGCSLKVCFAAAGDSVWELARREHTSPDVLAAENGLTGAVLEQDTVLLIPMC